MILESILSILNIKSKPENYYRPNKANKPSIIDQIIFQPVKILNPYTISLQRNYYYPISKEPLQTMTDQNEHTEEPITNDELMNDSEPKVSNTPPQSPQKAKTVITVEDSLEVIKELIEEIEADEAPIQTEAVQNPEAPSKMSSYRHRFALYRKNIHHKSSLNQIDHFKSLAKCLKSTDHSIQILPMQRFVLMLL